MTTCTATTYDEDTLRHCTLEEGHDGWHIVGGPHPFPFKIVRRRNLDALQPVPPTTFATMPDVVWAIRWTERSRDGVRQGWCGVYGADGAARLGGKPERSGAGFYIGVYWTKKAARSKMSELRAIVQSLPEEGWPTYRLVRFTWKLLAPTVAPAAEAPRPADAVRGSQIAVDEAEKVPGVKDRHAAVTPGASPEAAAPAPSGETPGTIRELVNDAHFRWKVQCGLCSHRVSMSQPLLGEVVRGLCQEQGWTNTVLHGWLCLDCYRRTYIEPVQTRETKYARAELEKRTRERDETRENLRKRTEERDEVRAQLLEACATRDELRKERDQARAECERLRGEMQATRKGGQTLLSLQQADLNEAQRAGRELQAELNEAERARRELQAELKKTEEERGIYRGVIAKGCELTGYPDLAVQQGIVKLKEELTELKAVATETVRVCGRAVTDLEEKNTRLVSEAEELRAANENLRATLDSVGAKREELRKERDGLRASLPKGEWNSVGLRAVIEAQEQELAKLRARFLEQTSNYQRELGHVQGGRDMLGAALIAVEKELGAAVDRTGPNGHRPEVFLVEAIRKLRAERSGEIHASAEGTLQALRKENERLQAVLHEHGASLTNYRVANGELAAKLERALNEQEGLKDLQPEHARIAAERTRINALETDLRMEIGVLQETVSEKDARMKSLAEEGARLRTQVRNWRSEYDRILDDNYRLQGEIATLKANAAELRAKNAELSAVGVLLKPGAVVRTEEDIQSAVRTERSMHVQAFEKLLGKYEVLRAKSAATEEKLEEIRVRLEADERRMKTDRQKVAAELIRLTGVISDLRVAHVADLRVAKEAAEYLKAEGARMEEDFRRAARVERETWFMLRGVWQGREEALRKELLAVYDDYSTVSVKLRASEEARSDADDEIDALSTQRDSLRIQLEEAKRESTKLHDVSKERDELCAERDHLRAALEEEDDEKESLLAKLEESRRETADWLRRVDQIRAEEKDMGVELVAVTKVRDELKARCHALYNDLNRSHAQRDKLTRELEEHSQGYVALRRERDEARAEASKVRADYTDLRARVDGVLAKVWAPSPTGQVPGASAGETRPCPCVAHPGRVTALCTLCKGAGVVPATMKIRHSPACDEHRETVGGCHPLCEVEMPDETGKRRKGDST